MPAPRGRAALTIDRDDAATALRPESLTDHYYRPNTRAAPDPARRLGVNTNRENEPAIATTMYSQFRAINWSWPMAPTESVASIGTENATIIQESM
jgi:hypothetical protein